MGGGWRGGGGAWLSVTSARLGLAGGRTRARRHPWLAGCCWPRRNNPRACDCVSLFLIQGRAGRDQLCCQPAFCTFRRGRGTAECPPCKPLPRDS